MNSQEPNRGLERTAFQLRAAGIPSDTPNGLRSGIHTRGYLPHVKREGASYFVTFRLMDSLPQAVLLKLEAEHAERFRRHHAQQAAAKTLQATIRIDETIEEIDRDFRRKIERFLDKGEGECWLKRPAIADLVATALPFFDGDRYRLDEWVVMPNHVHAVLCPAPNHTLSAIVQSWKRFTSREANKILKRTGETFWQPEAYDHWIRNDTEHARCCRYVVQNPVSARLCSKAEDWRWSSASRARACSADL